MWLPLIVIGGVGLTLWKKPWAKRLTAERKVIYETAMKSLKDPTKLRALADGYEKAGLTIQASMLRARADYIELPQDVKDKHRAAFEKAMKSTNVQAIQNLAKAFSEQGQTQVAAELQKYADGLKAAQKAA